jgi:alpha/beta superfamily hydrolase
MSTQPVTFRGPGPDALTYEGVLHIPDGAWPFPAAILCHPHSLYGGSMEVGLLKSIAEALAARGWLALRFNFRGVGKSQGHFTGGEGEMVDILAALAWLEGQRDVVPERLGLVGYSFGAWVGLRVAECEPERIKAVVAVALYLGLAPSDWLADYRRPKCFIHGERDRQVPIEEVRAFVARLPEPKTLITLPADHFFIGREREIGQLVADFLATNV